MSATSDALRSRAAQSCIYDLDDHTAEILAAFTPPAKRLPDRRIALGQIVAALTYALDLTSAETSGHTLRTCVIGMNVGRRLFLSDSLLDDLYYTLLLKDAGCSSNSVDISGLFGMDDTLCKHVSRTFDWSHLEWQQVRFLSQCAFQDRTPVQRLRGIWKLLTGTAEGQELIRKRCETGSAIARRLTLSERTADAILCLDEHWDGSGEPSHLRCEEVPLLSQICSVAQTLEVFEVRLGREAAVKIVAERSGAWFDPGLAADVLTMHETGMLWVGSDVTDLMGAVVLMQPAQEAFLRTDDEIDGLCSAFAEVIDAKSPFTYQHSLRVARLAEGIGRALHLNEADLRTLRRAGLLHDLGKLATSSTILEKTGLLSPEERVSMQTHPEQSYEVLRRIADFEEIAQLARSHHERLDGSGYPDGLASEDLSILQRVLAVADVYDALTSNRPYREPLSHTEALGILRQQVPHQLDETCVDALEQMD